MKRKITSYLESWKNSPNRKPLIVQGARQVGKTWSVLEFGREHYDNVAYFNFETNPRLAATFDEDISPGPVKKKHSPAGQAAGEAARKKIIEKILKINVIAARFFFQNLKKKRGFKRT